MEPEAFIPIIAVIAVVAVVVGVVIVLGRKTSERLEAFARQAGVQGVHRPRFSIAAGVRGLWNGQPVTFTYMPRQKSTPARAIIEIGTRAEGRLIIRARRHKPWLPLFEPPAFPLRDPALEKELNVRTDEPMLAERVVYDAEIVAALLPNLLTRWDKLTVRKRRIAVQRAIDEPDVKAKFGQPRIQFRFNEVLFNAVLREEWQLVQIVAKRLSS